MATWTRPYWSACERGRYLARLRACWLMLLAGSLRVAEMSAPVTGSTILAEVWGQLPPIWLKSPVSSAGVGMQEPAALETWLLRVPWKPPKKKNLSVRIFPPRVPPNWLRLRESLVVEKKLLALMRPPGWRPLRAGRLLASTENSRRASGKGKGRLELVKTSVLVPPSRT